ncbi:LysR family transcriptional regulator [Streptomyces sp. NPDC090052]|uniref:LysR family transcriptional regulator n=1 Tax=unclassified Streptomyces TaxID=2593676 RepID=UPI002E1E23B8|nr:LysR substrate-binding domain-containing protein [Streptomyces sp. NBC_01020]WSX41122.1 LysR substrate-binding domain-containing protein [Streptomyces sp. NBC_00963]WSX70901.1 LysR substrate-binding domain-containing protein [Streptomyces sp. NBC_00932]
MDLRQLEYFLAVVDHGGVNKAAVALRVAQPSLSQAVRKLEKGLGTELFHRVGRRVVLSPAGEALVGPARMILREVDAAHNAVRDVSEVRTGRIDISSLSDLSTDPLSVWVARFRSLHPHIKFRIEERDDPAEVAALVKSGACELGFLPVPVSSTDLEAERLVDQRLVLVSPPGTEERWPDPVPIGSLSGTPFVLGERGTAMRDHIEKTLRSHGVEPRIVVEVRQRGAVLPMVLAGGAVAIVPLRVALDARYRGGVLRELSPGLSMGIGVISRRAEPTGAASRFLAFSKQSLNEWVRAIDRHMSEGDSLIDAAARTAQSVDRRVRRANLGASTLE